MPWIILAWHIFRYLKLILKMHFKAIIFIHVAFINNIEVFSKISIREISNILLIFYFSHIFIFNTDLGIISRTIFFEKWTYIFIWRSYFVLNMIMYMDGKLMGRQTIWRIICWNRWRNVEYIKNNAWVTVNNDFWSRLRWFANDFHECTWKALANHITGDQKSFFTVMNVLFYFIHTILCSEHTIPLKQSSIAHFVIVAKNGLSWLCIVTSPQMICDVMRTNIVTSYWSIVLARANWRKGELH